MKKLILSTILCVAMLVNMAPAGMAAASDFSNAAYTIDYTTGQTSISFDGALPHIGATILVLNPDKTLADALTDDAIQYQYHVSANESGAVKHTFTLNMDASPADNEYYDVYVKIPGRAAAKIVTMCYMSSDGRADIVSALKGSKTDIAGVFADSEARGVLGLDTLAPFGFVDKDLLAERMEGEFSAFSGASDFDEVSRRVKEFCVLELYNQNMTDKVYDSDGAYLWEDVLSYDAFDTESGGTINACYRDQLSTDAQTKVREALFDKDLANPEELKKEFAVNTVLEGLTSPRNTGYAHVEKLLTDENCSIIELNLSQRITGDEEVEIAAYKGSFKSVDDLEKFIEDLFEEDSSSGGSGSRGGSGTKSTGSGSFSVETGYLPQVTPAAETVVFTDMDESHWAFIPVVYLKAKGVVNGVDGNLFLPDGQVTREQFVKMLFAVLDIEPAAEVSTEFADVDPTAWYAPYICAAVEQGIVNGISETEFGVGMYATRQDICTMLYRALEIDASTYKEFTDEADIADYAYDAVGILSANGIVNGYPDGSFRPAAVCTRAEAASLIYNAATYTEVE